MIFDKISWTPIGSWGDSFVYVGAIRHFALQCNRLYVPVLPQLQETMSCLFREDSRIEVISYQNHQQLEEFIKQNGLVHIKGPSIFTHDNIHVLWEEQTYTWYDLPFSTRYTGFSVPANLEGGKQLYSQLVRQPEYMLIHNHMPRHGYLPIDFGTWRSDNRDWEKLQQIVIDPDLTTNMLDWVELILNATEIHCITSCFHQLIDGLVNKTSATLYLHAIRKQQAMRFNNRWNNNRWNVINYQNKVDYN